MNIRNPVSFLLALAIIGLTALVARGQSVAEWKPAGLSNYGDSPFGPTLIDPHLTSGGLVRGPGVTTASGAPNDTWGGTGFTQTSLAGAIDAGTYYTLSLQPATGYTASLSGLQARVRIPEGDIANYSYQWQFSLNGGGYVDIGTPLGFGTYNGNGTIQPLIDLSGVAGLQSFSGGVTLRMVVWYTGDGAPANNTSIVIGRGTTASVAGLFVNGAVTAVPEGNTEALFFLGLAGCAVCGALRARRGSLGGR